MEHRTLLQFDRWHLLFDELCNRAGYFDEAILAGAYCALIKRKDQKQFETVMRSLNNWRSGRHIPRPSNLKVLARLLNVSDDRDVEDRWNALYTQDRKMEKATPAANGLALAAPTGSMLTLSAQKTLPTAISTGLPVPMSTSLMRRRWSTLQVVLGGLMVLSIGVVLGSVVTASGWRPWAGPADNAPIVDFRPNINMRIGDARNIYAERGDCGKLPRDWPQVEANLPFVRTGTFSDGGLARRFSKFCQGLTPARAIRFTATTAGVEEFEIQGDFFKMTVVE